MESTKNDMHAFISMLSIWFIRKFFECLRIIFREGIQIFLPDVNKDSM